MKGDTENTKKVPTRNYNDSYRMETRTRGPYGTRARAHAYLFSVMAKYTGLQVLHSHSVRAMMLCYSADSGSPFSRKGP